MGSSRVRVVNLFAGVFVLSFSLLAGAQSVPGTMPTPAVSKSAADVDSVNTDSSKELADFVLPDAPAVEGEPVATQTQGRTPDLGNERGQEGYHWKGLLWQSLGFIAAEDTYRLSTDYFMRHLIAEGPYWANYGRSMQHWDMNRWSDGDDFLVDDIGHPMQGAVSAFIEIQNSPKARMLQFSDTPEYWKSRTIALLWATAYSTQQKIGPLGEAALGDAGGYTYALHCPATCTRPGAQYTNNTGWTDFIMTPAGGTVWMIGEDLIDRYFTGPIVDNHPGKLFPKILRGTLNPTRTAANALRGKNPWYRDYEHPDAGMGGGGHFESGYEEFLRNQPRYEIYPHFNGLSIPVNSAGCTFCRTHTKGGGVGFSARLSRWFDFDSDVDFQGDVSPLPSNKAGGDLVVGTFGLRTGLVTPHYALKFSVRPGFATYSRAYLAIPTATEPIPPIGRVTHFATSVAVNGDYGITRNFALRVAIGNTPVRYLHGYNPPGVGKPPYFSWLSREQFMTNENWDYQVGPVLRF